jgi:pimeloyl-ACP methyl ester carboxylesterase
MRRPFNPPVLKDQELCSIKVPTLYLVGENEKLYSAQKAVQRLNKVAPHIKTEIIPNAGHDLEIVQAEMVNRKILDFLKQS